MKSFLRKLERRDIVDVDVGDAVVGVDVGDAVVGVDVGDAVVDVDVGDRLRLRTTIKSYILCAVENAERDCHVGETQRLKLAV